MFVELSVVEQRYQAVLAVISEGVPVVEVASRFGVSRQTVHRWLGRYEREGLAGLVDRSHRPPRSGVYRLLKRSGLIDPDARKRRDRKFWR